MKQAANVVFWLVCASCAKDATVTTTTPPVSELAHWTPGETRGGGTPAQWLASRGPAGEAAARVVATHSDASFNLLLSNEAFGPDVELSTLMHADAGVDDRGGGLVWRARDADNYYVTRWNPLENNLRAYTVQNGVRQQLASVDVALDATRWHELRVRMVCEKISVLVDGREALTCANWMYTNAGKIGLWTKADASSTFVLPTVRTL